MTSFRSTCLAAATLAILASACSTNTWPSPGTGGTVGTGGTPGQSGTGGGQSGVGGTGGGGTPGQGGTTGSGGSTLPGTGGANATGGRTSAGSGGAGTGGRLGSGGAGVGGASTDTGGSTRTASGGSGALGGATSAGSGGSTRTGSGGATGSGSGGTTGPGAGGSTGSSGADGGVVPSAGCGKTPTLKNGTINITFSGASRKYILHVPDGYDNNTPYRLVFAFAESGSSAQSVADRKYFTMQTQDTKNSTIFAAPDAVGSAGSWSKTDVDFTDAILAQLEGDLCVDKTRIFATGFSFGGAMSIALACTRADVFRAVAFFSGADLTGSCPTTLTKPIAYWASQASQDANGMDRTNPMTGEYKQAQFAAVNGCTADPNALNFPAAGQPHTCTNYKNCSAGHPTIYCVFDGAHGWEPKDPGQSASWAPKDAWTFITQF
jgi:poly(3-hydroxybutyrate) depolymerase